MKKPKRSKAKAVSCLNFIVQIIMIQNSYIAVNTYTTIFNRFTKKENVMRYVPELEILNANRPSNTKLRRQVKGARASNKNGRCNGAAHLL